MRGPFLLITALSIALAHAQRISPDVRQKDLNFVLNQLPHLHPNFFFQLDPTQFQQAGNRLSSQMTTATDAEFYVGLGQLVAMAGDAHTALALTGSGAAVLGFQSLPLQLRSLSDGFFVTAAAAPYGRALGAQLVAVGGTPIADVLQQLGSIIPHANTAWLNFEAQQYLVTEQVLEGLHIVPSGGSSNLTFRTLAGEQFTLPVAPASGNLVTAPDAAAGPLPDYLQSPSANYWFRYAPELRLLYFRYSRCIDDPGNPFARFLGGLFQTLDANPVDTLVVDLRSNTGGDSNLLNPFFSGLLPRYAVLLANPRFRLYVAVDKGTFSSGMDDAMVFKQPVPAEVAAAFPDVDFSRLVRVIGEPTGGRPAEYGDVQQFTLPGSGLPGQYSTKYLPNPSYVPDLPSFVPDISVNVRSTDFFARHDPVLAAILARTDEPPAAPSGSVITVNGASFRPEQGLAAGSFAAAFGAFGPTPDQVLVAGVDGKIIAASSSQLNFIVPASVTPGPVSISVRAGGVEVASGQAAITAAGPGIFLLNSSDVSQPGAVQNQDYSVNGAGNPATAGSVVQIFATGYGVLDASGNAPVQVLFGDVPAKIWFSGPVSQLPGFWQINAEVPSGITGQVPLSVVAGSLASNGVTIYVH